MRKCETKKAMNDSAADQHSRSDIPTDMCVITRR